jgi:hypothetical protein
VAIHVHDVVEVARTAALGERTGLLCRELGQGVAEHSLDRQLIAVGVDDPAHHRRLDEHLIARQIELELGRCRLGVRAAVGEPRLCGRIAAQIAPLHKAALVDLQLHAGLFAQPRRHPREYLAQLLWVGRTAVAHREVEILGEAVGLVVTLAQAGSALEDPRLRERWLGGDRGEHPSEHVVLFDHAEVEPPLGARLQQFLLADHDGLSGATLTFARRPQRGTRGPSGGPPGSSSVRPAGRRS